MILSPSPNTSFISISESSSNPKANKQRWKSPPFDNLGLVSLTNGRKILFLFVAWSTRNFKFCHRSSWLFLSLVASLRTILSLYTPIFNIISVADHTAPSYYFVELFSRLIAILRVVYKLLPHGWLPSEYFCSSARIIPCRWVQK